MNFSFYQLFVIAMIIASVFSKDIVSIVRYRDENGRIKRRFVDENVSLKEYDNSKKPVHPDTYVEKSEIYKYRKGERLALELDDLFSHDSTFENELQNEFHSDNYKLPVVLLNSTLAGLGDISLFGSYARTDIELSELFSNPDEDLIVIAPTNMAIMNLNIKPWQFPNDIELLEAEGASGQAIDLAINDNISKFVRSHVVSYSANKESYETLQPGLIRLKSVDATLNVEGDILLKKELDGSYKIASVHSGVFHSVSNIENAVNGVILVIDACLETPAEK